jgi:uncharacterized protein YoxC
MSSQSVTGTTSNTNATLNAI